MDLTRSLKTCARTRCAAAEGADVMATQSRGGVHRSERFQIHCLKSAVRLERRDKGGHEGLRAIDTAATVSAGVRRHPRCKFRRSWLLREIRASVSLPRSSISALIRLGFGSETEQRPVRSSTLSSCDRGRAVEGGRGLGSRSRFKAHALLELSCPLKVPIGHECQLCFVPAI
jgi:hypothetical protein